MTRCGSILLAVGLLAPAAAADDEVVLYTNADLARFATVEPAASTPPPPAVDSAEQWAFVRSFLDREYERIESDRALELQRAALRASESAGRDYGYAGARYGHGFYGGYLDPRSSGRHGTAHPGRGSGVRYGKPGYPTVRERFFTPIRPIHARPHVGATPPRGPVARPHGGGRGHGGHR